MKRSKCSLVSAADVHISHHHGVGVLQGEMFGVLWERLGLLCEIRESFPVEEALSHQ